MQLIKVDSEWLAPHNLWADIIIREKTKNNNKETRFPLNLAENDDVGETVIWEL